MLILEGEHKIEGDRRLRLTPTTLNIYVEGELSSSKLLRLNRTESRLRAMYFIGEEMRILYKNPQRQDLIIRDD